FILDCGHGTQRIIPGAYHKSKVSRIRNLFIRKIELSGRLRGPVALLDVPDNAYDFPRVWPSIIDSNVLANGVLVREDAPGECLVDYCNSRTACFVLGSKVSPAEKLYAHGVEIVWTRNTIDGANFFSRRWSGSPVYSQAASPDVSRNGKMIDRT